MGKRTDQRAKLTLPVRIYGMDRNGKPFTRLAHTVDVSASGVRIGSVGVPLKIGDVVGVQHGLEKARFKVVWIGNPGTEYEEQIGLESLQPEKNIWRVPLPKGGKDPYEPKPRAVDRRRYPRYDCELGVELRTDEKASPMYARCTDISLGGCYVETWSPLPPDTEVLLRAKLPSGEIDAKSIVRAAHPAFGMAVKFLAMDEESEESLKEFVAGLSARQPVAPLVLQQGCGAGSENAPEHETAQGSEEGGEAASGAGQQDSAFRVLIVEDSRFQRNACAHFIRREGIVVLLAEDGEQALEIAVKERPDMIVLDLLLPRMGGVETLRHLKQDPVTSDIPVLALSGLSQSNEAKLISSGAFAYLEKTRTGPEDLAQFVKRALLTSVPPATYLGKAVSEDRI